MTNLATILLFADEPSNTPTLGDSPFFWLPRAGSTTVQHVDPLFNYLMWTSAISLVLLMALMGFFVAKYRAKSRHEKPQGSTDHHTGLELIWSIVPLPVMLAMFAWGFQGFVALRTTPKDAYEIHVTGQKWKWLFDYPNGYTDDVLHVPVGQKVRVIMTSVDVVHSFGLPGFRTKEDVVPGRYTELWFEPTVAGEFPVFCDQYCGTGHSAMITKAIAHSQADFDKWLVDAGNKMDSMPPEQLGEKMYNQQGCAACHSLDGTPKTGPSWKGLFDKMETMSDGTVVKADENYIKQSMMEPQSQIVKGFPPAMPTFKGKLSDKKIAGIIAFIKAQK
ncbi:MAG TPA: cytochrome c oxidase subunit II [Polyangiaceae bacterium]|jgi:cytochrome c oxidase subunit 2|nr:cytochrome c oxidase subunit II [Polyangiaceae bacterium]